ncbi:MAG: ribonuclease HII [Bacteroidales bacterium]|nr:ribonuclease HII [Bacteroidales bacterium]
MLQPYLNKAVSECGVDEAGRGCLAGSVFAAAVILPNSESFLLNTENNDEIGKLISLLNDSKQLSDKQRRLLRPIIEKYAVAFSVAEVSNEEIDRINILEASILAMNRAIKALKTKPEFLLIDGNRFHTDTNIPFKTIIKGDASYMSIAAASVLAKTYRDDAMIKLSSLYTQYNWQKNKGYPTKDHRNAIKRFGVTPFHRLSFNLLGEPSLFD